LSYDHSTFENGFVNNQSGYYIK